MAKFPSYCSGDFNQRIEIFSVENDNPNFQQEDVTRNYISMFKVSAKIITKPVVIYSDIGLPRHFADITFILLYHPRYKIIDNSYRILYDGDNYQIQSTENKDKKNIYFYMYANCKGSNSKNIVQ